MSGAHGQFVSVERLDDFGRQERLQLLNMGILSAKVAELPWTSSTFSLLIVVPWFNLFKSSFTRSSRDGRLEAAWLSHPWDPTPAYTATPPTRKVRQSS